jgi:hypothetical protein
LTFCSDDTAAYTAADSGTTVIITWAMSLQVKRNQHAVSRNLLCQVEWQFCWRSSANSIGLSGNDEDRATTRRTPAISDGT